MRKAKTVLTIGLLVALLATSSFAASSETLLLTAWQGPLTFIYPDGTTATDNATLTFFSETGDFSAATLSTLVII
jgi:hypothetical protein